MSHYALIMLMILKGFESDISSNGHYVKRFCDYTGLNGIIIFDYSINEALFLFLFSPNPFILEI